MYKIFCIFFRNSDEISKKIEAMCCEIEEKDQKIRELNDVINKCKTEIKMKENDSENLRKKNFWISEMLKNLQNHVSKMENALSATNKSSERQQKEKNEIAEKLLQSIKLIMEEKSARQTIEQMAVEKEKNFQEQIDQIKVIRIFGNLIKKKK